MTEILVFIAGLMIPFLWFMWPVGARLPTPHPEPVPQTPAAFYKKAYAITLEKESPERYPRIKAFADKAGIPLEPWPGVRIIPAEKDTLPPLGIGTTNYSDRLGRGFNWGVIGAFLAHRNLMTHIAGASPAAGYATLIFEDDVEIPANFHEKLGPVLAELPSDWDILFLDKIRVEGTTQFSKHLLRLPRDMTAKRNWGMWGFFVRNAAIRDRILPVMEHMTDVPDIQLNAFAHKINCYLTTPSIVAFDVPTASKSVVTELDGQAT